MSGLKHHDREETARARIGVFGKLPDRGGSSPRQPQQVDFAPGRPSNATNSPGFTPN